jgi:hypothetical protein
VYGPSKTLREWERRKGDEEIAGGGERAEEGEKVEELAAKILDRVRLMRVFEKLRMS